MNSESKDAFASAYSWEGTTDTRGANRTAFRDYIIKQFVKKTVTAERIKADQAAQLGRVGNSDLD